MFICKKKRLKRMGVLLSVLLLFSEIPLNVYAQAFTHVHTNACRAEVTKTCTSHFMRYGREYINHHCDGCGTIKECIMDTYTDVCGINRSDEVFVAYKTYCRTCGRTIDERPTPPLRTHNYTVVEVVCGKNEGETAATVSVSVDNKGWTNKSVGISCSVNVQDPTFSVKSVTFSDGSSTSSAQVSENGNYSFTVTGSNGQSVTESVTVSNIDKTAPILSLSKSTSGWTESGLTISASASDDASGIGGFSFNGGGFSSGSSWEVKSNGTYSVTVTDNAGNTASASITVSNIGKDPAEKAKEEQQKEEERRKEEERKKEEERRKKEQAEKDEESKNKSGSQNNNNNSGAGDKKPNSQEEANTGKDVSNNDVSGNGLWGDDTSGNDISGNDTSGNDSQGDDVSGNLIPVNTYNNNKPLATVVSAGMPTDPKSSVGTKASLSVYLKNHPGIFLAFGLLSIFAAFLILSSMTFVYASDSGRVKLVARASLKGDGKKLFVRFPVEPLEKNKEYRIFYSLKGRLLKDKKKVILDVDTKEGLNLSDDKKSFVFKG